MRRPAPHHWRDQWLREPEAGQALSGRAGQQGAERWQGLRSTLRPKARSASPSCWVGRRLARESRPAQGGPDLRGPQGYLTHGLCRPGRAVLRMRVAGAHVLAILPYSSRRDRRGEGAERLRVGAAQGMGAAFACSWWRGFLPVLPKEERMGYQSRKGRCLGVPALEGSERAVGAGLYRHVGGRFGFLPEESGAGPCRYGCWLAQAEG